MIIDNTKPLQTWSSPMNALMCQIALRMSKDPDQWLKSVWISSRSDIYDFTLSESEVNEIKQFFGINPESNLLGDWADEIAGRI